VPSVKDNKQWRRKSMREREDETQQRGDISLSAKAENRETRVETETRRSNEPCEGVVELLC